MPTDPPVPTDSDAEASADRIALWLDPSDLQWLAKRCGCEDSTPDEVKDRCARIRFRASAALHKAGPPQAE